MEATASAAEKEQQHTLWASLVEAVRGSHQDYTTGGMNRAILLLGRPDGAGDGAGIAVRGGRHFLGRTPRGERHGNGGPHRVDAEPDLLRGHGLELVDHRHGGAAHWREKSRRRGRCRRAGNRSRADGLGRDRPPVRNICAEPAAPDGSVAGDRRNRQQLHQNLPGRKFCSTSALSQQRYLPRCWRRGHCHASALGLEHHQPGARSLPDLWLGTVPALRRNRRGFGNAHRAQHRRALPVLSPDARHRSVSAYSPVKFACNGTCSGG